jgi:hypothetical protein
VHRPDASHGHQSIDRTLVGLGIALIARSLHPDGLVVNSLPDIEAALETTPQLVNAEYSGPNFYAAFSHDDIVVPIDILERYGAGGCPLLGKLGSSFNDRSGAQADRPTARLRD